MIKLTIETKTPKDIERHLEQLNDFFVEEELKGSILTLAGKLAAKDAFLRNIGISNPYKFYKKIEIDKTLSGRPFIRVIDTNLHKKSSKYKTTILISHTKEEAVAICVL
ncbi:MAG: hypothetical protein PHI44_05605, partial [Candidatus Ratteibacteria bacterium]|nr:hypothetical protein [Candidatus Ratteibacteria bacterium]